MLDLHFLRNYKLFKRERNIEGSRSVMIPKVKKT